jgi:glycolate oxidase iron-sulfur subunit
MAPVTHIEDRRDPPAPDEASSLGGEPGIALRRRLPEEELCIRCGACLPSCPTYAATGLERESPRGRTQLIRAVAEDRLRPDDYFLTQMYDCLDCRACEAPCPVSVPIGSLILEARAASQRPSNTARRSPSPPARFGRWALERGLFAHPRRMEWPVFLMSGLYQRSGLQRAIRATGILRIFPLLWRLESWLPVLRGRPWRWRVPEGGAHLQAHGPVKMRAAYFLGCFMNTVFADAAAASVEVLRRNGVEVVTPQGLQCCGAPQMDLGDIELAREFAKTNIAILEASDAAVVYSDCAACSGMLKEYGDLLRDDPDWGPRAARLGARTQDFSELVLQIINDGPPLGRLEATATFHDPCHLAHLQRVTNAPRALLQMIPGLRYVEMPSSDRCCGSAGTYSFRRWDQSMAMLDDKIGSRGHGESGLSGPTRAGVPPSGGSAARAAPEPGPLGGIRIGCRRRSG